MAELKEEEKIQKAQCGAILIASSAAANAADIAPRKKCDKTEKAGNLVGTVADIGHMQSLFVRSGGIDCTKTFCETPNHSKKSDVLKAITDLFNDTDRFCFILYYSGHGRALRGDWCFEKGKNQNEFIALNDILTLYKHRQQTDKWKRQKLIIIADCCFSGRWVEQLQTLNIKNVFMQSSCKGNQTCIDGKYGGVFTRKYMDQCILLLPKKKPSKLWWIPGIFGAVIGALAMVIKDKIIMNLYEQATKTFTPSCFSAGEYNHVYVGDNMNGKNEVYITMYRYWNDMNLQSTGVSTFGWFFGHKMV